MDNRCFFVAGVVATLSATTLCRPAAQPGEPPPFGQTPDWRPELRFKSPPAEPAAVHGDNISVEVVRFNATGAYEQMAPPSKLSVTKEPDTKNASPIDHVQVLLRLRSIDKERFHPLSLQRIGSFKNEQGGESTFILPAGLSLVDDLGNEYKFESVRAVRFGSDDAPRVPDFALVAPQLYEYVLKPEEFLEVEAHFSPTLVKRASTVTLTVLPFAKIANAPLPIRLSRGDAGWVVAAGDTPARSQPCLPEIEVERLRHIAIARIPALAGGLSVELTPVSVEGQVRFVLVTGRETGGCAVVALRMSLAGDVIDDLVERVPTPTRKP